MKKRGKSSIICLLIILLALVVLFFRNGFSVNIGGILNSYPNGDKYTAGGATVSEKVKAVDISWIAGEVSIETGDVPGIVISEKSSQKLNDNTRLHFWLDGTTLRIRPNAPGLVISLPSKELTLTVPDGTELDELKIETVSAGTKITGIRIDTADFNSTSGEFKADRIFIRDLDAETVSGDLDITADGTEKANIQTVSGDVSMTLKCTPSEMKLNTVSGGMDISLPGDSGFRLGMSTVSGDFDCGFPVIKENKDYVCGDGKNSYSFNSVSGDFRLKAE